MPKRFVLRKTPKATPEPESAPPVVDSSPAEGAAVSPPETPKTRLPVVPDEPTKRRLPPLVCGRCFIAESCPEYVAPEEGQPPVRCYYERAFQTFDASDPNQLLAGMYKIVAMNMERLEFARLTEKTVSQGAINPEVTALSKVVLDQMQMAAELKRATQTITVTAEGRKAGGLLAGFFGAKKEQGVAELNPPGAAQIVVEQNVAQNEEQERITITATNKPPLSG